MKAYALLFALLLSGSVFAFTANVPEETIFVPSGSSKELDIPFYSSAVDDVAVTVLDSKPWITQSDSNLHLEPGVAKVLTLYMNPFIDTAPGVYKFTIIAESLKTGEEQKKFVFVSISKMDVVDIEKMTIDGNFTPAGNVNINGVIKNYKDVLVENVRIITTINSSSSKLVEFEQPLSSIDSGESQIISYTFQLPRYAEAGLYTVSMKTVAGGETREKVRSFSVARASSFIKETTRQPGIFGFRKIIEVTNIGNEADDVVVSDTLSSIDAAFYSGEEPLSKAENEFTWLLKNVQAGEVKRFVYHVDYSPAILFAGIVVIASWVFFFRLRTLRINKKVLERKFIEQGEEFTVGVEVMNMSGSKIDNATIRDFVPSVFEIKDSEGPKPTRKKVAAGIELTWHIKDLHKNEERILTYKIIPVFGIHGSIRLPRASMKYNSGKKEVEKKSFYATIGIDMDSYKDKKAKK